MSAILFGSISTVADTSEIQREAFNEAFRMHGLDWSWGLDEYRELLTSNGGEDRIAEYARNRGESVDAAAVHESKSKIFQGRLAGADISARPGVVDTVRGAKETGWKVALVTTTSTANIEALFNALDGELAATDFDLVIDATSGGPAKPDPAAYTLALEGLSESASDAVAIEDNIGGVRSAVGAGIVCVAFPNENTTGQDFGEAPRVEKLGFDELAALTSAA